MEVERISQLLENIVSEENNQITDRISQLPEFIVHHILSFLESPKDLVRTSVLSKNWFDLTASFPILDFNEDTLLKNLFSRHATPLDLEYGRVQLLKYALYTTSRFCDQDQDIRARKFYLFTSIEEPMQLDIVDRCVRLILKKGVKVFSISILRNYSHEPQLSYRLPNILLSASSLICLTICQCEMPSSLMVDVVMFKSLRLLCLYRVLVDEDMIKRLISGCPLLMEFDVSFCSGFKRFCIYEHQNLQTLKIFYDRRREIIDLEASNVCQLRLWDTAGNGAPTMNLASCKKIKILSYFSTLPRPEVCTPFLSNFPFLENLVLELPNACNKLKLSSNSLRTLVLISKYDLQNIELNTPNLLFFKCSDYPVNCEPLVIDSAESKASMECYLRDDVDTIWFQKLKRFLDKKNGFKILKLHISEASIDVEQLKLIQSTPCEFEHVELHIETMTQLSVYVDVMDALLLCCRTRSLTLTLDYRSMYFEELSHLVKVSVTSTYVDEMLMLIIPFGIAYEKLLKQEDQRQTNVNFLLSSYSTGKKHFGELNSLLTALPCDRLRSITFLKEEDFQKHNDCSASRLHDELTEEESTSNASTSKN